MVARVVPQSARRRHAESRKPDLWGWAARPKAPVLAALFSVPCPLMGAGALLAGSRAQGPGPSFISSSEQPTVRARNLLESF